MSASPDAQSVTSEVNRIAESPQFVRSKRLIRFLRFTVSETLQGRADALSEHLIATQAYERPASFDPQLDPIIRSEARRLRSKLNRYYRGEGHRDPVIIKYRPGSYAPSFYSRDEWQSLDLPTATGEMGLLIAAFNWSNTILGPITTWPANLRFMLDVCLRSRFPMAIYWGTELVTLYNDAKAKILGSLHPAAMGQPASAGFSPVWGQIGPNLESVLKTGESFEAVDQRFTVDRSGYLEECYFSCSYSVIRDDSGVPGGVLVITNETTARVLAERRRAVLRELSMRALEADTTAEACRLAAKVLSTAPLDIPFAAIYRLEDPAHARLEAIAGDAPDSSFYPVVLDVTADTALASAARKMLTQTEMFDTEIVNVKPQFAFPLQPRSIGLHPLLMLPLVNSRRSTFGLFVAGLSPHRLLDIPYKTFLGLVAAQISSAVTNAQKHEEETRLAASFAEVDQAKTQFLAHLSKELRRTSVDLTSDLQSVLVKRQIWEPQGLERVQNAYVRGLLVSKALHSLQILTNLDQFSKEMICEPLDVAEITHEIAELFRPAIEKAGLKLKVHCFPVSEPLYLNREVWETITSNLLSNALKFTENGEIGVITRQTGPIAEIVVWDTGEGISPDDLPHIFERFYRANVKRARSLTGSGMGLTLVKDLLSLHGATIRADSQLHRGSSFTIFMPIGQVGVPGDRVVPAPAGPHKWSIAPSYVQEALFWGPFTPEPSLRVEEVPQSDAHFARRHK